MIVRTLAAPAPKVITQKKVQKQPAKKTVAAGSKPKPAAPIKKKKTETKLKPPSIAKKAPPIKEDRIFKEISNSLQAMETEAKRSRSTLTIPSKIEPAKDLPSVESTKDATYSEYLIAYLQTTLDLPEYGEVRAKIEIDRFGRLIDCIILEAKSNKNAEFLKNQLPALTFSCLNDFGIVDSTQTFTITFRNVEIR